MTKAQLFTPLLHPDLTASGEALGRIGALLRNAPPGYSGKRRPIAISCEVLPVQNQHGRPTVLPLFDFSVHRHYPDEDIAGQALYDELNPLERDHFEPAFRILHGHDISKFFEDPLLSAILARHSGLRMTLAYMEGAIALFPSQLEAAFNGVSSTPLADLGQIDRGAICTLLVAPPSSHHARLRISEALAATTADLATILHGHMTNSFEDGHVRVAPLSPSAFAQVSAGW